MQYALPNRHIAGLGGYDYHGNGGGGGVVVTVTAVAAAAAAVIEGELIGFTSAHYRYLDGIQGRSGTWHLIDCYIGSYFCHLHFFGPWVFYMHSSPYTAAILLNIYLLVSIPFILNGQAIAFKNDGGVKACFLFLIPVPVTLDGHGGVVSAENNIGHFEHVANQLKHILIVFILGLKSLQVDVIVKFEGEYNFRPAVYLFC